MKKMAVLVSLVAFATVLSGCGLSVEGTFRDSRGGVVYQGKVSSGQQITVGSGGMAFLHVTGCASRDDVVVSPASEVKGCCGGTTVVVAGGGVAIATVAIWAIVDFVLDRPTGFDFVVGPMTEDTIVSIGDDFFFTLLVGDDIEGEGEIPTEGEGKCESLSVSIVSPADGANIIAGGTVNVVADIVGDGEVEVVMVSPEGDVHRCTVTAPSRVAHHFTLTSLGSGLFTARAEDRCDNVAEDSVPVIIVAPTEGEGEGECPAEGEGEIPAEGEGECESLSVNIISPTSGTNILSGGVVTVVADIGVGNSGGAGGSDIVDITVVSPDGLERRATFRASGRFATSFVVNLPGQGRISVQAENPCGNVSEDSVPVNVVVPDEGELSLEGEPYLEGEGEPPAEGEGECPVEGEGEDLEGEPYLEGEGEPPAEGEGECPEGEAACFTLEIVSPADGSVVASGASVVLAADITAPHEVSVVMVSPEGEVYRRTVVPPIRVTHSFTLTLRGSGLLSVRVTDAVTGEVVEKTRAVVVS